MSFVAANFQMSKCWRDHRLSLPFRRRASAMFQVLKEQRAESEARAAAYQQQLQQIEANRQQQEQIQAQQRQVRALEGIRDEINSLGYRLGY